MAQGSATQQKESIVHNKFLNQQIHHGRTNSLTNGPVSKFSTPNKLSSKDISKVKKMNSGIINDDSFPDALRV